LHEGSPERTWEAFAGDTGNKKRLLKKEVASSIKTVV